MSIKAALEILGYGPCYHMKTALTRPWQILFWIRAGRNQPSDWKRFYRRYRATIDWPSCEFYRELMEVYPDAMVLLNTREAEEWYDSVYKTIYRVQKMFPPWMRFFVAMQERLIWEGRFRGDFENREKAVRIYMDHHEEVKSLVPHNRLLVYDVKEGWEPLCRFLGVNVPENIPFPHLNETGDYLRYIRTVRFFGWLVPASCLALLAWLLVSLAW